VIQNIQRLAIRTRGVVKGSLLKINTEDQNTEIDRLLSSPSPCHFLSISAALSSISSPLVILPLLRLLLRLVLSESRSSSVAASTSESVSDRTRFDRFGVSLSSSESLLLVDSGVKVGEYRAEGWTGKDFGEIGVRWISCFRVGSTPPRLVVLSGGKVRETGIGSALFSTIDPDPDDDALLLDRRIAAAYRALGTPVSWTRSSGRLGLDEPARDDSPRGEGGDPESFR
jgi:hypothetical protein